jgi:hypothetical protein
MPCGNLDELITIVLDPEYRLRSYNLVKENCGHAIGRDDLLLAELKGITVDELLRIEAADLVGPPSKQDTTSGFLNLKHLYAIRAALEVFTGAVEGGPNSPCVVLGVSFDGDDRIVEAAIDVNQATSNLMTYGTCQGG